MTELKNLAAALAAFQAEMPTVHKGKTAKVATKSGGSYSYDYADLADVSAAAMPLLTKHGLSFLARPRAGERGWEVCGMLLHDSGEHVEAALPLHGGTAQEIGSSLTYARRYLMGCLTGIVTDADDDGQAATRGQQQARQRQQQQTAKQQTRSAAGRAAPQDTGEAIADKTRGRLFALLGEAPGLSGDDDMQRQFLTDTLGRVVESRSSLTEAEGRRAIGRLEAWARGEAGAEWSPFEGDA